MSQVSGLKSSAAFKFTLKSWPAIAFATIGLCFLTQQGAKLFGIELPDQQNVEVVRRCLTQAFTSGKAFLVAALLVAQVIILMPALEECIFRLPLRWLRHPSYAVFSAALFSAAHYIAQPWPDAAFLALFFFGLAQWWLYTKTRHIWCAMLNHALFNLTNLVLLFVVPASK